MDGLLHLLIISLWGKYLLILWFELQGLAIHGKQGQALPHEANILFHEKMPSLPNLQVIN